MRPGPPSRIANRDLRPLRIEFDGRTYDISRDETYIGRDPSCDLQVGAEHGMVSRRHAVIRRTDQGWLYGDLSRRGSFVDGRRIDQFAIDRLVTIRLSDPADGVALRLVPGQGRAADEGKVPPTIHREETAPLRLRWRGQEHVIRGERSLTFGRDPSCDFRTDNPVVSAVHAELRRIGPERWELRDRSSSNGIETKGGRPAKALVIGDSTVSVWIGPRDQGDELHLFPPGHERATKRRRWILSSAAGLVALAAFAALLIGVIGDQGSSEPIALDRLKNSAVLISAASSIDEVRDHGWGSGSIISADGLIVTNAHVAAPGAPGLGILYWEPSAPGPDRYTIFVYDGDDQPVRPAYQAEEVVSDGWLDLTILKIVADAQGRPVDPSDLSLEHVELGDSRELRTGDEIWVLGFPALSGSQAVDVQKGTFASAVADHRTGDPRGWLNTSGAIRITGGNSGGMGVDAAGHLIGVPSRSGADQSRGANIGQLSGIHRLEPLLAAARSGGTYDQYQYLTPPTGGESAQAPAWVAAGSDHCVAQSHSSVLVGTTLATQFTWSGIGPGQHVFFGWWRVLPDGRSVLVDQYVVEEWSGSESGCAPLGSLDLPAGEYVAQMRIGPNFEVVLGEQRLTVSGR